MTPQYLSLSFLTIALLYTFSVFTSAWADLANSPWPMLGHDLRHTGRSSTYNGPSTGTVRVKWTFRAPSKINTSPTIGEDGTVYIGAGFAPLFAVNPHDGTEKWNSGGGGDARISSPTVSADGTVYMGARDNDLWAVAPNGQVKWRHSIPLDGDIYTSPAIDPTDGGIYMSCGCLGLGFFHKLNPSDGSVLWQLRLPKGVRGSSPAIDTTGGAHSGTIYIGSVTGLLNALTPDGSLKWSVKVGGKNAFSSPVIGNDGTIYQGTYTGLAAVRPSDGQALPNWPFKTEGRVASSAALGADGTIYVGTTKGVFYAINPDGTQKWEQRSFFNDPIFVSPAIGANGIIYTAAKTTVYALDPTDGSILWQFTTKKPIKWSSPAIGENNTLYIGSVDKNLYALIED